MTRVDQPAIGWRNRTLTREQVAQAADDLDGVLEALDVTGTHVLLYGPLCPAYVVGLLACMRCGAVPVPIDAGMSAEQYAWIERTTRPALVVSSDVSAIDLHRGVAGTAELVLESGTGRIVLDTAAGQLNSGAFRHVDPDAGYLIPTSGSTGRPKAVVGSRRGLNVFLSWFVNEFALGAHDVCAAATRVSFDPSLRELLAVLAAGGRLLLPEVDAQLDPPALARHLATADATLAFLVPSLARRTAQALTDQGLKLPALRYGFFAGEPLPGRVVEAWTALAPNAEFVNLYGMTEGTLAQLYRRRVRAEDGVGHGVPVGRPRPGVSLTIDAPDARGHGEVLIRSGAPALGLFHGASGEPGEPFIEPMADVLHTGDLGFESPNGEIVVIGRLGDDMKVSGRRVSFHPLVEAVETLPGVSQCVVVDVVDRGGPHAFIAIRDGDAATQDAESLVARVRDIARGLGLPLPAVHLRSDLPLLRSGKVDRVALAAAVAEETDVAGELDGAGTRAADDVTADLLALLGPAAPADASVSFVEAGLTSLELIDFVLEVNRRHGTELTVRDCYDLRNLNGVADIVARTASSSAATTPSQQPATADAVVGAEADDDYPLSTRQLAYMAVCMADGNANWCNLSREVVVPGTVTAEQVEAAVAVLIARHDVLRLALSADGTRLAHVAPEKLRASALVDAYSGGSGRTDHAAYRARVEAVRAQTVTPLIDPAAPPPLRLAVVPGPRTASVILVGHHLFLDGLSMDLLADELHSILLGRPLNAPSTQSYRAYCAATSRAPRRDASSPAAQYWLDLLAAAGQTELPEADGEGARAGELLSRPFGLSRSRAAHRIAAAGGVSVFAVALAAYSRAVAEEFSLEQFNIVIPVQVREGVRSGTAGMYMSQLVVHGAGGAAALVDSARELARQLDDGARHSDFEFDERAEALGLADSGSFPLSTILFNQHPRRRGLRPDALGAWRPRALGRDLRYQLQGELQMSGAEMVLTYYYRRGIAPNAAALVDRVHGRLLAALAEADGGHDDAHI
jgi:mycobactin peptide synthetase MbtE